MSQASQPLPTVQALDKSAEQIDSKIDRVSQEIREQFKRMDKDGSGALDINDLLIMAAESRAIRARTSSDSARNSPRRRNRSPAKPI